MKEYRNNEHHAAYPDEQTAATTTPPARDRDRLRTEHRNGIPHVIFVDGATVPLGEENAEHGDGLWAEETEGGISLRTVHAPRDVKCVFRKDAGEWRNHPTLSQSGSRAANETGDLISEIRRKFPREEEE